MMCVYNFLKKITTKINEMETGTTSHSGLVHSKFFPVLPLTYTKILPSWYLRGPSLTEKIDISTHK